MFRLPKRLQRRLVYLALILLAYLVVWYTILPADSPVRLAVYFNASRLRARLRHDRDVWLHSSPPLAPDLDLTRDVGFLVKTGYGTRHRVPDQMQAFAQAGGLLGPEGSGFIVVGDWTTVNETDAAALGVDVHDAIKMVLEHKLGEAYENYPRFMKYRKLQAAIESKDEEKAYSLGQTFGWELDALKVRNHPLNFYI